MYDRHGVDSVQRLLLNMHMSMRRCRAVAHMHNSLPVYVGIYDRHVVASVQSLMLQMHPAIQACAEQLLQMHNSWTVVCNEYDQPYVHDVQRLMLQMQSSDGSMCRAVAQHARLLGGMIK